MRPRASIRHLLWLRPKSSRGRSGRSLAFMLRRTQIPQVMVVFIRPRAGNSVMAKAMSVGETAQGTLRHTDRGIDADHPRCRKSSGAPSSWFLASLAQVTNPMQVLACARHLEPCIRVASIT